MLFLSPPFTGIIKDEWWGCVSDRLQSHQLTHKNNSSSVTDYKYNPKKDKLFHFSVIKE
jgi:hypothetical protein